MTNLEGDAQGLYEETYCARGEMENRLKGALGVRCIAECRSLIGQSR